MMLAVLAGGGRCVSILWAAPLNLSDVRPNGFKDMCCINCDANRMLAKMQLILIQ